MRFKCHNCGVAETFVGFIRRLDESLYAELVERLGDGQIRAA
jgi:hypothetical protein